MVLLYALSALLGGRFVAGGVGWLVGVGGGGGVEEVEELGLEGGELGWEGLDGLGVVGEVVAGEVGE